ncbi:MAG: hypothetical protein U0235_23645 [Polyangiaceae bacterium]
MGLLVALGAKRDIVMFDEVGVSAAGRTEDGSVQGVRSQGRSRRSPTASPDATCSWDSPRAAS